MMKDRIRARIRALRRANVTDLIQKRSHLEYMQGAFSTLLTRQLGARVIYYHIPLLVCFPSMVASFVRSVIWPE